MKVTKETLLLRGKYEKGITLIALMITIIVLLILAGVTLNLTLGEKGIFKVAQDATKLSKVKELEEQLKLAYMDKVIGEILEDKKVTIETIVNDLKAQGYTVKEQLNGTDAVIGIIVKDNVVTMDKNQEANIIYTIKYSEGKVNYFVEIDGKYHEIIFNNEKLEIREEATNIDKIEEIKNKIVASSTDANVVTATIPENDKGGKILLTSGNTGGNVKVTITEENSGVTTEVNVTVKEPATSFTVTPTEATVMRENTTKLTATVEPSNTTDKVIWSSSDESIATVSEDGTVTGIAIGTATITAKCGELLKECTITVEGKRWIFNEITEGKTLGDLNIKYSLTGGLWSTDRYPSIKNLGYKFYLNSKTTGYMNIEIDINKLKEISRRNREDFRKDILL